MAINLQGRVPRVVSGMSNTVIWVAVAAFLLVIGFIAYGFSSRFRDKENQKKISTAETVAHDSSPSNRETVRAKSVQDLRAANAPMPVMPQPVAGSIGDANGTALDAKNALVGAVKTVASPFPQAPSAQPGQQQAPPGYYPATPYQQPYLVAAQVEQDPEQKALAESRVRAIQRKQEAIEHGFVKSSEVSSAKQAGTNPLQGEIDRISELSRSIPSSIGTSNTGAAMAVQAKPAAEFDPNGQGNKREFQKDGDGDYVLTTRTPPISPWVIERGEVIPACIPNRIVSDLPGDIIAEVRRNVYDSPKHKYIMIPAGSLLAGEYNSNVSYGQGRVQAVWPYLRYPDGSFIDMGKFPSHSADGATGLADQTDNHLKRLVGIVALSSLFSAGIQLGQNRTQSSTLEYPSTGAVIGAAVSQQAGQVGEQLVSRERNVQPTLKIRPGDCFAVSVTRSLVFPGPYEPLKMGGAR